MAPSFLLQAGTQRARDLIGENAAGRLRRISRRRLSRGMREHLSNGASLVNVRCRAWLA